MPQHKSGREFNFTKKHYQYIQNIVTSSTGIMLPEQKEPMVYGRVARRLRKLGLQNFDEYISLLQKNVKEVNALVDVITTNVTHFFREEHHFEFLANEVLPQLYANHTQRIRIWSAGCSTGQEPYSLAITLDENPPTYAPTDIKILATDLSTEVLETARAGVYPETAISKLTKERKLRYFQKNKKEPGVVQVHSKLKERITFNELNLMNSWPFKGPFQVIFCRNVIIYFSKDTQQQLFKRYADMLTPGGYLFLGHSEHIFGFENGFQPVGKTIYQKIQQ